MKPAPFSYHSPATVEETLAVLADLGADGKVLAGGQSLIPILNMRLSSPPHLVDINRVGRAGHRGRGRRPAGRGARPARPGGTRRSGTPILPAAFAGACAGGAPGHPQPRHGVRRPRPRRPGQRATRRPAAGRGVGRGRKGGSAGARGPRRRLLRRAPRVGPRCGRPGRRGALPVASAPHRHRVRRGRTAAAATMRCAVWARWSRWIPTA